MHVVQVGFHADIQQRSPEALLEAWPGATAIASATAREGCRVTVVQVAHETATIERDGVTYRFQEVSSGPWGGAARQTR